MNVRAPAHHPHMNEHPLTEWSEEPSGKLAQDDPTAEDAVVVQDAGEISDWAYWDQPQSD